MKLIIPKTSMSLIKVSCSDLRGLFRKLVTRRRHLLIYVKKLISLKHCVRSQITRLKLQKSFCDLEHGASL